MIKTNKTKTLILAELQAIGLQLDWDTLHYRTQHRSSHLKVLFKTCVPDK